MAFKLHTIDDGRSAPIEYLPAGAITPKLGMALYQTSGNLAIATGKNKPTYISMYESSAALTAGTIIPVIRVEPDMIFETVSSAAYTNIKLGDKVTMHTDGMKVTATTSETSGNDTVLVGVAEVVYIDDTAEGGMVRVRF